MKAKHVDNAGGRDPALEAERAALKNEIASAARSFIDAERLLRHLVRKGQDKRIGPTEMAELVGVTRQTIARWAR